MVSTSIVQHVGPQDLSGTSQMKIHLEAVSNEQQEAIRLLAPLLTSRQIYLAGGTSVGLQLGHRRSFDLDWFSSQPIADPMALARDLKWADVPFETGSVARGTLHGEVLGVRVSLLEFRYPLLRPPLIWAGSRGPIGPVARPRAVAFRQ
jgi:hypothetical protein